MKKQVMCKRRAIAVRTARALCLVGVAILGACGSHEQAAPQPRAVRTVVVAQGRPQASSAFAGEVKSRVESHLGFRVGGKVLERRVELGQHVCAGQVLAQLDAQDLKLTQASAQASVAAAQVQVKLAGDDLRRYEALRAQGFISEAELSHHQASLESAQATLRQVQAQAGVQTHQAGYATLLADACGVITSVDVEPGEVVAAGAPLLTLAHDGAKEVVFAVPEDTVQAMRAMLSHHQGVLVRPWGSANAPELPATVREVAAAADPMTRTYLVKADLAPGVLELGQSVTISLAGDPRANAGLMVPLIAVVEREGRSAVWVLDAAAMTVHPQAVLTGSVLGSEVTILAGLRAGEEVVTAGTHVLVPGQRVRRVVVAPSASAPLALGGAAQP